MSHFVLVLLAVVGAWTVVRFTARAVYRGYIKTVEELRTNPGAGR